MKKNPLQTKKPKTFFFQKKFETSKKKPANYQQTPWKKNKTFCMKKFQKKNMKKKNSKKKTEKKTQEKQKTK